MYIINTRMHMHIKYYTLNIINNFQHISRTCKYNTMVLWMWDSRWGYHVTFWVQNTPNFKRMNERILMGPGAHSPPLKYTLELYSLYTQNVIVFHWLSIKIYRCLPFSVVQLTIFWLSINKIPQTFRPLDL